MKNIKMLAIVTTAVCGFYFTSAAQTTETTDQNNKQSTQASLNDKDDQISLNSDPTIEKSSQGYKLQVWVQPNDASAMGSDFDDRYDTRPLEDDDAIEGNKRVNTGTSTDLDRDNNDFNKTDKDRMYKDANKYDKNKSDYRKDDMKGSGSTSWNNDKSTSIGSETDINNTDATRTTGATGITGKSGTTSTIGENPGTFGTTDTLNKSTATANEQNSDVSRDTWRAQSNVIGQPQSDQTETSMLNSDKSKVFVKVIDESTGKEIEARDIEMKVTTPSKKSFTTDLRDKENHHEGELALTEDGTYNIQATIQTDDNKSVVIPFTYDHNENTSLNQSTDDDMIDDNR